MTDKTSPVHAGMDIAKASLQLHLQSKFFDLPNSPEGHAQLLKRLAALHAGQIPVSVINPARVRQFARASGELAKTDPIAAAMLTAFGQAFTPAPTQARTAVEIKLAALVTRRLQLIELRVAEEQRAATCADPALCKLFTPWLAQMEKQISKVEVLIEELLKEHAPLADQVQRLDDIIDRKSVV